ncbi:MAG: hydrogenase iron-sulfur subunit [Anaerolineae bacterium]|nr:hydrogenase iron-sulfur subunit [Anaerolineae bacterium]
MSEDFEPRIIGFLCNWCSYAGADAAGTSRLPYPPNIRIVRVMCSGRVSPELVLRTFREGADGVLVLGCHIGDCHYTDGNHRTAKRIPILRKLLSYVGIEPERLRLEWVSSSEAQRFAQVVSEFTETVRRLGPLELKGGA